VNPETRDDSRRQAPQTQADADAAAAAAAARNEAIPRPPVRGSVSTDLSDAPTGNCVQREGHAYTERQLHYKADPNSHSQRADAWRQAHNELKDKPIDTDGNGMYTTKFGDDPSTIAARSLRDQGQAVSQASIRQEWSRIVGLNRDAYPDMGKNMDFLADGIQLRMTDCKNMPPAPVDTPQPRPDQPHRRPHRDHYNEDGDVPAQRPPARPPERPQGPPAGYRPDQPVYAPPPDQQGYGPPPPRPGYPPPRYGYDRPAPVNMPPDYVQPGYAPPPGWSPGYNYNPGGYQYGYGRPNIGTTIAEVGGGLAIGALIGGLFGRHRRYDYDYPYYGGGSYYGGGGWYPHHRRWR
jgi:hypothetical protein